VKPFEAFWEKLDPKYRRILVVGLIVIGALAFFSVMALLVPEPRKIGERKLALKHLLTDSDPRTLGIEGLATQLRQVTQKSDEVLRRIETLEDQQKQNRDTQEERFRKLGSLGNEDTQSELNALKSQIEALRQGQTGTTVNSGEDVLPPLKGHNDRSPASTQIDNLFDRNPGSRSVSTGKPMTEIRTIRAGHDSEKDKGKPESNAPSGEAKKAEDEGESVFIPAGTILSGNLLNGLDAPTGKKARKEPFPVLARIKAEAILPNRYRADLRECFLVAAGYGDLSAERAYIRSETLSCVRQDGGVIEVPIDAYAVGEDGKVGLRGAVVSKQGQLMATSLLAGFAKGISDAFGKVQIPVFMTGGNGSLSSNVPYQNAFSTQAMEGSSLRGVGYSMDRMAHYYMDLAENLFPVVEIDATRQIEFVIQRGTELKLYNPKDTRRPVRTTNRPY
jgi:conjugal transfer pilus assembly protein TraB